MLVAAVSRPQTASHRYKHLSFEWVKYFYDLGGIQSGVEAGLSCEMVAVIVWTSRQFVAVASFTVKDGRFTDAYGN